MKATLRLLLLLVVILALGGGAYWFFVLRAANGPVDDWQTAAVTRGELVARISATGTVEPEELVDVGAQVAGQIRSFGTDTAGKVVDYGSVVEAGAMLATIDDSLYNADVASARAELAQAEAGVTRAVADVAQSKAKLAQADRDWDRAQKLGPSDALAATTYDSYKAGFETATAALAVAEASLVQAKATVDQANTSLMRAERNLGFCVIKSPVSGVIIDRRVNIGQTVVSSLNAPSLFLIAKDLKRMQVWVAVNEADIGQIKTGLPVSFSVDAFPGEKFVGKVGKVRLNATMTQNVVTYTVEVDTDNSSGRLLPYLTANLQFEIERRENVLLVPNAALRWSPRDLDTAADGPAGAQPTRAGAGRPPAGGGPGGPGRPDKPASAKNHGTLYVVEGDALRPVTVRTGLTDFTLTEVAGDELKEGMTVVVGENTPEVDPATDSGTKNPFLPQMPRRRGHR